MITWLRNPSTDICWFILHFCPLMRTTRFNLRGMWKRRSFLQATSPEYSRSFQSYLNQQTEPSSLSPQNYKTIGICKLYRLVAWPHCFLQRIPSTTVGQNVDMRWIFFSQMWSLAAVFAKRSRNTKINLRHLLPGTTPFYSTLVESTKLIANHNQHSSENGRCSKISAMKEAWLQKTQYACSLRDPPQCHIRNFYLILRVSWCVYELTKLNATDSSLISMK